MAKRMGICANTVHAPCSTTNQKSYQSVPCAAMLPSSPSFLQTMDTATVSPKNANRMTGVYIAPPNRCMFCMMTSLLSAMCVPPYPKNQTTAAGKPVLPENETETNMKSVVY